MRRVNKQLMKRWVAKKGKHEAMAALQIATGLKDSTLEKIVAGRYPSEPTFLIRKVIAETTQIDLDKLFPEVSPKGRAS